MLKEIPLQEIKIIDLAQNDCLYILTSVAKKKKKIFEVLAEQR